MTQKMVITNLRVPEHLWMQVKTAASASGLSVNKYISNVVDASITRQMLGKPLVSFEKKSKKRTIWDLVKLARMKNEPEFASEEDKVIYGIT